MMNISVVMILRVYAMYNRSRIILGALLLMYIPEVVMLIICSSINLNPNNGIGTYRTQSADLPRTYENLLVQCRSSNCST